MKKDLLEVFNILKQFKNFKKEKYNIDPDDRFMLLKYYSIYHIKDLKLTLKQFTHICVNYSTLKGCLLTTAMEEVCKKIKYK